MSEKCVNCGQKLRQNSKFCTVCGTKFEAKKNDKPDITPNDNSKSVMSNNIYLNFIYSKEFREGLLFLGIFFMFLFSDILKAKSVMKNMVGISTGLSTWYDILASVLGAVCLSLYFILANDVRFSKNNCLLLISRIFKASCWILLMYTVLALAQAWIDEKFLWKLDNAQLYTVLYIISILILCIVLNFCFYWCCATLSDKKTKNLLSASFTMLIKPKLLLSSIFLFTVVMISQEGLLKLLDILNLKTAFSFSALIFILLLCIIVQSLLTKVLFNIYVKNNNVLFVPDKEEKKIYIKSFLSAACAIILFIVITVITSSNKNIDSIEDVMANDLNEKYSVGLLRLSSGDIDGAMESFECLKTHTNAWECAANQGESDNLNFNLLLNEYSSDQSVLYLSMLFDDDISEMEQYVFTTADDVIWYHALLNNYKKLEEEDALTDDQKEIQKELAMLCVMSQDYTDRTIKLEDIQEKKDNIIDIANNYKEISISYDILENVSKIIHDGEITNSNIDEIIKKAEEHPDNIIYQYAVVILGSSYVDDYADHYDKTVETAKRFDNLFEKLDVNEQEIANEKLFLADAIFKCKKYEEAVIFYEQSVKLGNDSESYEHLADCYDRLDKPKECLEYAKKAIEAGSNEYYTIYLAALGALKNKDIDLSLEYALKLSKLVKETTDNNERFLIESTMYMYLQNLTLNDVSNWTNFSYSVYKELSESQLATIKEDTLFDNYAKAMYYTFNEIDYKQALTYTEDVIKIDESLSQIYYLKGCIYFGQEDFKNAKKWFLKSLDVYEEQATVWYSLGRTYDALEEYQNAHDASMRVLAILDYNNHENDLYGVQLHSELLRDEVKAELDKEGNE